MGTAIKHPVSDRVKPSFVIWHGTLTLNRQCTDVKNYKWRLIPVGTGCFIAVLFLAAVGVKGL